MPVALGAAARLIVFLPIFSAGLYFLGVAYWQGFLRELGIPERLFPLTVDRAIFEGMIPSITWGVKGGLYGVVAAEILFIAAAIVSFISSREFSRSLLTRLHKNKMKTTEPSSLEKLSVRVLVLTMSVAVGFIGLLAGAHFADVTGRESAERLIKNLKGSEAGEWELSLSLGDVASPAMLITCSKNFCAYRTPARGYVIPTSAVAQFSSK